MRIQEVEAQVGITKKNIRYYEQEGLITPRRNHENGYREYGEADVLQLKKIRLLRRLGVPIEEIRRLLNGTLTVEDTMERHMIALGREMKNLELSRQLCHSIGQSGVSFADLDPDVYLKEMDELESKGASFVDHKKTDMRRKMIAPVVASLVMILIMAGVIGLLIWAYSVDPIPMPILVFLLLFPAAICIGVILALRSRYKEVQTGEYDEASKY